MSKRIPSYQQKERDQRLAARGIDAPTTPAPLSTFVTWQWLEVECELGDLYDRPISLVAVRSGAWGVPARVLPLVRPTDVVGWAADGILLVVLPDAGPREASIVVGRIAKALSVMEANVTVEAVSRWSGETALSIMDRAILSCAEFAAVPESDSL